MSKLAAGEPQSDADEADRHPKAAHAPEADALAAGMVARARWLIIISGLTTLLAIVAVVSVIGYRVFRAGGGGAAATADGIVMLPKGARVIASTVADERIVVTLDIGGATEIRTFDVKTLQETGRIWFATEP
jgi:predicted phage tail protein